MPQSSLTAWLQKSATPATAPDPTVDTAASKDAQPSAPPQCSTDNTSTSDTHHYQTTTPQPPLKPFGAAAQLQSQLHPNVELRACTKADLPHLKRLTSLLLPIPYSEHFFRETLHDPVIHSVTLLAVWHDDPARKGSDKGRLIGAIRCRILAADTALAVGSRAQPPPPSQEQKNSQAGDMLYLSVLVLLSPYRGHGIATALLQGVIRTASREYGVGSVGAHVWEANGEGLSWYRKRGFREVVREPAYYRRLDPAGAIVMQRGVRVVDLLPRPEFTP